MKKASATAQDKFNTPFATRLRELMDERKVTQQTLAEETELTRQAISQYSDGSVLPNIDRLLKIANYFNVSCDYMLGNTDVRKLDMTIQQIAAHTGLSEWAIELLSGINNTPYIGEDGALDLTAELLKIINFLIETDDKYAILSSIHNYLMYEFDSLPPDHYNRKVLNFDDEDFKDTIILNNKRLGSYTFLDLELVPYAMQSKIFDGLNRAKEDFKVANEQVAGLDELLGDLLDDLKGGESNG